VRKKQDSGKNPTKRLELLGKLLYRSNVTVYAMCDLGVRIGNAGATDPCCSANNFGEIGDL
jgi:hypothetical protein